MAKLDDLLAKVKAQGLVIDTITAEVNDFKARIASGQVEDQGKIDQLDAALNDNANKLAALVPPPAPPA